MTTSVDEEKAARLAAIAERSGDLAARIGATTDQAEEFLGHYFRHVDTDEVLARPVPDLLGLVGSHYSLALDRPPSTSQVVAFTPRSGEQGWSVQGATVVQIVTDDKPFLVDTVTMEVNRQGWTLREIYHPQFIVQRDVTGAMRGVLHTSEAADDPTAVHESWIHLELLAGGTPSSLDDLVDGLHRVLRDVDEAVADWDKMRRHARAVADDLDGEDAAFVTWLAEDNFTFLGYRHYRVDPAGGGYLPLPGEGLGILRADTDAEDAFHAWDPDATAADRLVITKDNFRSTVQRPAYLDYIGVRTFDQSGRLSGEHRFLGLFGASVYTESVARLPVLRVKAAQVLHRSGYARTSHGGHAVMAVLDNFPRDELFQTEVDPLADVVERVSRLKDRRQVRLFARQDPFRRFWSCLVYVPRDRYSTAVRSRVQEMLRELVGGESADFTVQVSESVLARLHVVVRTPPGEPVPPLDVAEAERALTDATRNWSDDFADELARQEADPTWARLAASLPEGYKEDFSAAEAIADLMALAKTVGPSGDEPARIQLGVRVPDDETDAADVRLKIFCRDVRLSLSEVLPHLTALGVEVVDERPYDLSEHAGLPEKLAGALGRSHIYEFGLRVPGGRAAVDQEWTGDARQRFIDAFTASWDGGAEPDDFQGLVAAAGISWRQAAVLRAIGRYLRQIQVPYSQSYVASALRAHPALVRQLTELFEVTFDPGRDLDRETRDRVSNDLAGEIVAALRDVESLDHDRIIRSYLRVMRAVVRTNAYLDERGAWTFKLLPQRIKGVPEPRPEYEIFVHSPRIEGVHLRFGAVARGGLRWSDRAEDYRTEVLGLVKAQTVKNTVIVPTGAKGGFVCKRLPDPTVDRDAWLAEGLACYRLFINGLLDVTDNIVDGKVVPPRQVLCYDGEDSYLVVAADKGTATFSDTANEIAVDRDFWMGDAFASGGSAGYDHKGMGITARGAWVSVRRHFREMGRDCQTEEFTAVGIGDMSGDVFGNGMLCSRATRLVAAFDHRHVFVDPNPDAAASHRERQRVYDLPRSSWADYDTSLISEGGGVFERTAKSITITEQMRAALGIADDVTELAPAELISAILRAPVDLLWNGGIGTYVKGSDESNGQVGDRANDVVRVNGGELRARCVGEGGNLGFTQLGRIEYARNGGRLNTDFIDNSAGVDTSDREVNIKILLAPQVKDGGLSLPDRDNLLASMTDEVAALVLRDNYDQNLALANAMHQNLSMAGVHEDWMRSLEASGHLVRELDDLPSSDDLADRRAAGEGLSTPELAVLMSHTKIRLAEEVLASDLPDDPWLTDRLLEYFPVPLQDRYAAEIPQHQLHRELTTTLLVNDFVNRAGITCFHRLGVESGARSPDVIRAHLVAREVFGAHRLEAWVEELDHRIDATMQTTLRLEIRTLVERATRWMINNAPAPIDLAGTVAEFRDAVTEVTGMLPTMLLGQEAERYRERLDLYTSAGVPEELARAVAILPEAYTALGTTRITDDTGQTLATVTEAQIRLSDVIGLDRVLRTIIDLPRTDRWQTMARAALRDDLHDLRDELTARVLNRAVADGGSTAEVAAVVTDWQQAHDSELAGAMEQLDQLTSDEADLARMSVALRTVRSLVAQS